MKIYDKNAQRIMDKDGITYVIEIGYAIQLVFKNPGDAINYAIETAKNGNIDVCVHVIRRVDQFTGEVLEDEE